MTPEQITVLAATGESETLEFKHTTGTRREAGTCCSVSHRRRCARTAGERADD